MIKSHHRLKICKQTWWDKNLPNTEIFKKFTGWLGDDSATNVGIEFTENNGLISVTEVKIRKFERTKIEL
jgi:hypothetical protein